MQSTVKKPRKLPSGAKIIHEHTDSLDRIPGLPYRKDFDHSHTVVTDEAPTIEDMRQILSMSDERGMQNIFPVHALSDIMEYLPSSFHKLRQKLPHNLIPKSKNPVSEKERVQMYLKTRLQVTPATIDSGIVHCRKNQGSVVSKAHHVIRAYQIGRLYGIFAERKFPESFGDLTNPSNWDSALMEIKMRFIELVDELPLGNRTYETRMRTDRNNERNITQKLYDQKYPHVDYLLKLLKGNLETVILYGSAVSTDDPSKYSDLDNLVMVKDPIKAMQVMMGRNPYALNGKVIECFGKEPPEGAKHIGLNILPSHKGYFEKYLRSLHDSREYLEHSVVLYGSAPFQKIAMDEVIESGVSCAYAKFNSFLGNVMRMYLRPEDMFDVEALFSYHAKTPRFYLQHTTNAIEKPRYRSKEELNEMLESQGMRTPEYKRDAEHIRNSMMQTAVDFLKLQKGFAMLQRIPDFSFMNDGKKFEWYGKDIDNWEKSKFDNPYINSMYHGS